MNLNIFRVRAKLSLFIAFFLFCLFFFPKSVSASEGIVELESTKGTNQRCFAMSLQTSESAYNVLVSCVNLIYPSDTTPVVYVIWSRPIVPTASFNNTIAPIKLGTLGFGKVVLSTSTRFSSLFVTLESNNRMRIPAGETVMEGQLQPISFLKEAESTPTPTPEPTGFENLSPSAKTTITPTKAPSPVSNIVKAFVTFVAVLLAIVILGVIIFVIYKYRKSNV